MGMFDDLHCDFKLPIKEAQTLDFQTKDTPNQTCSHYRIAADGSLWEEDPESSVRVMFHGALRFYTFLHHDPKIHGTAGWIEFEATYHHGMLLAVKVITNKPAKGPAP